LERSNNKTKIQVENAEKSKSEIQSKKSELERTLFSAQEYLNEEKSLNKSISDKTKKVDRDNKKKLSESKNEKEKIEDLQLQRQQALDQQLEFQNKLNQTESEVAQMLLQKSKLEESKQDIDEQLNETLKKKTRRFRKFEKRKRIKNEYS